VSVTITPRYGFFQAVRLLYWENPDAAPVGQLGPPEKEYIWFCHDPRMTFSASDVTGFERKSDRITLTTSFLGLSGAVTPLGNYFAEEVLRSEESAGESLTHFYDLFHHRILSFVYRGWAKYRAMPQFLPNGGDPFTCHALALLGVVHDAPQPRGALPAFVQLSLAPILATRSRSARTLQLVLGRVFPGVNIWIESFVQRRVTVDPTQRTRLGQFHTTLGEDITIGSRVVDRSSRFRLHIGPVDQKDSERFLPGGRDFPRLRGIVDHFTRGVLEAEIEVELEDSSLTRFTLGSATGSRLGVTTRLGKGAMDRTRLRILLSDDMANVRPTVVTTENDLSLE
jgi:type VI secretion system protein ImpH